MDRSVIIGNFWTDPLGRLWIFFDQSMHHFDGRGGLWAALCEDPDADQPTWSDPRRIWHGSMLNKPTVLSTGEWMLPVQLLVHRKGIGAFVDGVFPELDPLRGANVFVSGDRGETWERRGMASFPNPSLTYDHNRTTDAEIYMARFTEEDVLAGELSGPRSRLRMLVSRAMKGKESATPLP